MYVCIHIYICIYIYMYIIIYVYIIYVIISLHPRVLIRSERQHPCRGQNDPRILRRSIHGGSLGSLIKNSKSETVKTRYKTLKDL